MLDCPRLWRATMCSSIWRSLHAVPLSSTHRPFPFPALQALIDGPYTITGVSRQQINFKRLSLTDLKVKIGMNAGHQALTKAWTKADIKAKWEASSWAKRLAAKKAKAAQSDFERFKAMVSKKTVRRRARCCTAGVMMSACKAVVIHALHMAACVASGDVDFAGEVDVDVVVIEGVAEGVAGSGQPSRRVLSRSCQFCVVAYCLVVWLSGCLVVWFRSAP